MISSGAPSAASWPPSTRSSVLPGRRVLARAADADPPRGGRGRDAGGVRRRVAADPIPFAAARFGRGCSPSLPTARATNCAGACAAPRPASTPRATTRTAPTSTPRKGGPGPEGAAEQSELRVALEAALAALPPDWREVTEPTAARTTARRRSGWSRRARGHSSIGSASPRCSRSLINGSGSTPPTTSPTMSGAPPDGLAGRAPAGGVAARRQRPRAAGGHRPRRVGNEAA